MTHRLRVGDLLALGLVAVVLVVLIGPIVLLTMFSFNDSTIISLPFEGFTLEWYRMALADAAVQESLRNSMIVATIVAPSCVVLGTATAWGITRFTFRGRGIWSGLVAAALVVPWLVIGVSGLVFFVFLEIDLSLTTITLMHIAVTFPLVTALVSARLVRFEKSQEEAAIDLGASQLQLMTRVVLPQLTPALAASLIDRAARGVLRHGGLAGRRDGCLRRRDRRPEGRRGDPRRGRAAPPRAAHLPLPRALDV